MTRHANSRLSELLKANADVVIADADHTEALNASEMLAWRGWFDSRARQLRSSGGRPTNPAWTVKRQIPFTPRTWDVLKDMAVACGQAGQKLAPAQVAGFLLEDAIATKVARVAQSEEISAPATADVVSTTREIKLLSTPSGDARFDDWTMPELFSGVAA